MKSIDSIQTCAYGTGKVSKKERIKGNNLIRRFKKWLTLIMLQRKT